MIADLTPYPDYKESGLPWLGQVPGHWAVRRLRASITDCVNGAWGADPNGKDDLICVRVADFDRVKLRVSLRKKTVRAIPLTARSRRLLQRGDLLLEKSGGGDLQPVGAVVAYDHEEPAVCSNFVARMPMASGYDTFFVNYLHFTLYVNRVNIRSIKQTTGIQNLDGKAYLSEPVAFPPPAEQAAIVRFLDWANGRLERAIRAKRKVIALLTEQKQAIIHRAVTRGLDPSVPLKPAGIPWLRDIPQHWEVRRLKFVTTRIVDCLHATPRYSDSGSHPAIRTADISPGVVHVSKAKRISSTDYARWTARLEPVEGDILYSREGERFGIAACVPAGVRLCISQRMMAFRIAKEHCADFVMSLLNSRSTYGQALQDVMGATAPHVNISTIRNFFLAMPARQEQEAIVEHLCSEVRPIEGAISRLEREIELLREYRTRLVADVVTGKLDVREAAARLPEEAAPDTTEDSTDSSDEADLADEEVAV